MKSKTKTPPKAGGFRLLEIAFWALPLLALIPNFFVIPDLTYPGLATQEVIYSIAADSLANSLYSFLTPFCPEARALAAERKLVNRDEDLDE